MALTVRTNGSGGSNLVGASWWNDYYNLLTGAMQDQEVTIQNNVVLKGLGAAPSVAPTAAIASGAGLGIGLYTYVYSFQSADGESLKSPAGSATTTTGNQKINVSAIATGPTGTIGRFLYRTIVGGGTNYKLVATIADNVTTTYTDTTADGSLGAQLTATAPTFGGSLIIKDSTGAIKFTIANDGSLINAGGGGTAFGNVTMSGTLTVAGTFTQNGGTILNNGCTINAGTFTVNSSTSNFPSTVNFTGHLTTNVLWDATNTNTWASITPGATTRIQTSSSGGVIALQVPGGTTVCSVNSGGMSITGGLTISSVINLPTGTLKALTSANGTGNGTSNTNITNPTAVVISDTNNGSTFTLAATTTSTTTVTANASCTWRYIAYLQ